MMFWLDIIREGDLAELRCDGEVRVIGRLYRNVSGAVDGVEFEGDQRIWRPNEVTVADEEAVDPWPS